MATKVLRLHRKTETKRHGEIQPQARFGKGMLGFHKPLLACFLGFLAFAPEGRGYS
jgi:hypothetical protein